jgi:hypothetical protein
LKIWCRDDAVFLVASSTVVIIRKVLKITVYHNITFGRLLTTSVQLINVEIFILENKETKTMQNKQKESLNSKTE